MTNEKLNEIKTQLGIDNKKWYTLYDVESISLKNGVGIYPNWKYMRFLFSENEIFIKHGNSKPYGARLITKFMISSTQRSISFPYGSLISSVSQHPDFREPKIGDILVASNSDGAILSECIIDKITRGMNGTTISLVNPIALNKDILLSFYDPSEYDPENCIHSSILQGVYMKFEENIAGQTNKKYGKYQEIIKNKNIVSFDLKLISKRTYSAR